MILTSKQRADRRYYLNNREEKLATRKRWRDKNPERHRFGCYRQHAKARKVEFAITFEQACALMRAPCVYCGAAPLNGIDRIDPNLGYVADNCESACYECNVAKGTRTKGEFLAWLLRVSPRFR